MRCSRRNTSNVPTPCYAMARYKSTTRNETNVHNFCYFGLTRLALGLSMPGSYTFAPISEKLSRMGHEVFARIRNTLILGLVFSPTLLFPLAPPQLVFSPGEKRRSLSPMGSMAYSRWDLFEVVRSWPPRIS